MKKRTIMDQIELPTSVDELLALARYGAEVEAAIKPRLSRNPLEPGRKHPSFQLAAAFTVKVDGRTAGFEKTYAKGHETAPPSAAANGFVIANTRLYRDVRQLWESGVKCGVEPFVLSELLPGTDLAEFEPKKPYTLEQFAILGSLGIPVKLSMTTHTRRLMREKGGPAYELYAVYAIHFLGEVYSIETRHGTFAEGGDEKVVARVYEVAEQRLSMEQHKLLRVGIEIEMGRPWAGGKNLNPSFALLKAGRKDREKAAENDGPSLHVVQG